MGWGGSFETLQNPRHIDKQGAFTYADRLVPSKGGAFGTSLNQHQYLLMKKKGAGQNTGRHHSEMTEGCNIQSHFMGEYYLNRISFVLEY